MVGHQAIGETGANVGNVMPEALKEVQVVIPVPEKILIADGMMVQMIKFPRLENVGIGRPRHILEFISKIDINLMNA